MKRLIIPILTLMLGVSCNQETKNETSNSIKEQTAGVTHIEMADTSTIVSTTANYIESEPTDIDIIEDAVKETTAPLQLDYTVILEKFIKDKANSTKRLDGRNSITRVISEVYHLSEFKNEKQEYVIYDSIRPIIEVSTAWQKIGSATNQETLDRALAHTNNGGLSLVVDTSSSYGHVVMVLPGDAKKSGSWAMKLPTVLSLLNHKPEKSFQGKSLAYALKKSEDLQVYIRKQ